MHASALVTLVGRDGREREVRLGPERQAALYARLLHRGAAGYVEVAGAERLRDGRLRFHGGRRDPADQLEAGDWRAFVARVRHHREHGREVFASPLAHERPEPTNAAVRSGRVLWVDLDGCSVQEGLGRLEPLRPHMVIASGGGVHGYWLTTDELPADELESGNRRLAGRLDGDLAVANRGRILRVPGTLNRKRGRPCQIVGVDFARPRVAYPRAGRLPARPAPDTRSRWRGARQRPRSPVGPRPGGGAHATGVFRLLCGPEPDRFGYLLCPLPDHDEDTPSCRLYEDHWWCYGCARGGGIYDLASLISGGPWGRELRGEAFRVSRELVAAALGCPSI